MTFWIFFYEWKAVLILLRILHEKQEYFIWFNILDQVCIFYFNFPSNCISSVRRAFHLTGSRLFFLMDNYNYWYPCPSVLHSYQAVIKYIQVFVVYVVWSPCSVVSVLDTVASFYCELWPGYVCAFIFEIAGKDFFYWCFMCISLHFHYLSYNVLVNVPVCMIKRLNIFTLS